MMFELDSAEAIGIYVMLLFHLRTKDNYEAFCNTFFLEAFTGRYRVDLEKIERVLHEFALFEIKRTANVPFFLSRPCDDKTGREVEREC